jgi:hypothetical protein
MPSTISEFISSFNNEVARPNRFDVQLSGAKTYNGVDPKNLILRCDTAQLPSITYATTEQKFGSNPIEKYPYLVAFNDVDLTFIVSDTMKEKMFFDGWMEQVAPSNNYNFNYKIGDNNSYAANITINQYNLLNALTYSITLVDAYPITVNQLDLDWSSEGYHKLAVVFAYTYWTKN